ncbi:33453_t:CDS:2 [Gigaspora margarita]|uniref:33453_t:CDS:1 n=1 Tax=Gigaspora margarita TaxID=4874 RepID=A0ABM8W029_GIGMA|nr:33453_t:CDS:2 [Gigaspora margarita]
MNLYSIVQKFEVVSYVVQHRRNVVAIDNTDKSDNDSYLSNDYYIDDS